MPDLIAPLTIINRNRYGQIISVYPVRPVVLKSLPVWNDRVASYEAKIWPNSF